MSTFNRSIKHLGVIFIACLSLQQVCCDDEFESDEEEITMNCTTTTDDLCTIKCDDRDECEDYNLLCSSNHDCSIDCSGYNSCKSSKINTNTNKIYGDMDITCSGSRSCQSSNIYCSTFGNNCHIICSDENSCKLTQINDESMKNNITSNIYIECTNEESCKEINIYCGKNSDCTIQCKGEESCKKANIYCSNRTKDSCNIECTGEDSCQLMSIHYYIENTETTLDTTMSTTISTTMINDVTSTTTSSTMAPSTSINSDYNQYTTEVTSMTTTVSSTVDITESRTQTSISSSTIYHKYLTTDDSISMFSTESTGYISESSINGINNDAFIIGTNAVEITSDISINESKQNSKDEATGLVAALVIVSSALAIVTCVLIFCCIVRRFDLLQPLHSNKIHNKPINQMDASSAHVCSSPKQTNMVERVGSIDEIDQLNRLQSNQSSIDRDTDKVVTQIVDEMIDDVQSINPIVIEYPDELEPGSPRMMQRIRIESMMNSVQSSRPSSRPSRPSCDISENTNTTATGHAINNYNNPLRQYSHQYSQQYNNINYNQNYNHLYGLTSRSSNSPTASMEGQLSPPHSPLPNTSNSDMLEVNKIEYIGPGPNKQLPQVDPLNQNISHVSSPSYSQIIPRRRRARTDPVSPITWAIENELVEPTNGNNNNNIGVDNIYKNNGHHTNHRHDHRQGGRQGHRANINQPKPMSLAVNAQISKENENDGDVQRKNSTLVEIVNIDVIDTDIETICGLDQEGEQELVEQIDEEIINESIITPGNDKDTIQAVAKFWNDCE